MANIKDIAKKAGVSVTTVSRVLNNHPYVSEGKREAVLRAMEEFNYQRNINAVHLSKGETLLIGVVVPFTNHPYFGLLVEGIANEAMKNNYKLVLFQTNYEEDREIEALKMLQHKQIDSLIICSRICGWDVINQFTDYGPIVLCEDARNHNVSSTFIDHYMSFSNALEYLHNKGHQKIGYCIGRKTGANSRQRGKAYTDFLSRIGELYNEEYIFYECLHFEHGEEVVRRLLNMDNPPTALLVTSDFAAAGIVTSCREKGIHIPDALAIMGFDNQPIAKIMHITTLEIPLVQMGRQLLLQAIDGEKHTHEEISVKLIERQTV
ncbi:LacI family DNA-binding transcriptional regulator [Cytobacillus firmus]|uniref:LacI family DNA-binding transcriptional regulator n=1 Tax=Cytobacillus firmus TaxID=1399 RepID=UPI001C8ED342|nr:LacI family DNA-binding transcriptional regulator [Cytobacillus firmus]MBX9976309.1 LacI family DNA-binding transcriptional regulator [Cytobacillus firmus]